jgi:molecular chaperone DnaJ
MSIISTLLEKLLGAPGVPGRDLLAEMEIDLEEAARGDPRVLELERSDECSECAGTGWRAGAVLDACPGCGGRGEVIRILDFLPRRVSCPTCLGAGPPISDPCPHCRGAGRTPSQVRLEIVLPRGVDDGMWLQLRNQGEPGQRGGPRGNLKIRIRIRPHPRFERCGNDLYCKLTEPRADLVEGDEIEVPTLEGPQRIRVSRRMHQDLLIRVKGRGMPDISGSGRGDLIAEIVG